MIALVENNTAPKKVIKNPVSESVYDLCWVMLVPVLKVDGF